MSAYCVFCHQFLCFHGLCIFCIGFLHWISALDFFDPVHGLIPLACIARTCTCTLIHSSVLDGRGSPAECGYMTSCLKGNHGARK